MSKANYLILGAILALIAFVVLIVKLTKDSVPQHKSPEHMAMMQKKAAAARKKQKQTSNGTKVDQPISEGESAEGDSSGESAEEVEEVEEEKS